jgi:hypothetical protein
MGKALRKYNFFHFILHFGYAIIDIFGLSCNWLPTTRLYHECREEMVKQVDVLYLMRRVVLLERAITTLMTVEQLRALHLMENKTLAEAKRDRRKFRWNDETFVYRVMQRCGEGGTSEVKEKRINDTLEKD